MDGVENVAACSDVGYGRLKRGAKCKYWTNAGWRVCGAIEIRTSECKLGSELIRYANIL